MPLTQIIKEIDLFSDLNNEQIDLLTTISTINSYSNNSILYYESESNNKLIFLISGLMKVYKVDKFDNEIFLYNIQKNSMISELTSLEKNEIYCFSNAEFIEDSKILSVDFEKFNKFFIQTNILTNKFMNELLKKTHQLQCIINRELVFDATAKVSFMLCNELDMFNKLKRQEVSFMLHIQPETLSRVLKRLSRNKTISVENGEVIIINKKELISIFRGVGV